LTLIKDHRDDWATHFLSLLFQIHQGPLRDYILKELLHSEAKPLVVQRLQTLIQNPASAPDLFVWYFQKIMGKDKEDLPFSDKEGQFLCLEAFLILFSTIENKPEYRDLVKKMYTILSGKRYAVVREIIEGTSVDYIKEFLLLVSKCQTLSDHDIKILRSLAEVVHPSIAKPSQHKGSNRVDPHVIWTTEEGYLHTQDRIRTLGTVEIIENAREIEAARALGDLRENSEYKFALEKRSRLQGELKFLSDQLNKARIITPEDIHPDEIGIGSIVDVQDSQGNSTRYTILGPWDANPDTHILSFQSKLAQTMLGCKEGDTFRFKDEEYTIGKLKNFFEK
jgi:transcription elongation GreA/GreB family factor